MMNESVLKSFESWCMKNAKKSKGTTNMYIKYIKKSDDFALNDDYETIFKIIQKRVKTNPERYAFILFLKYLKDSTTDFSMKKNANMIILDLKDLTIGSNKSAMTDVDELRYKVLTKDEISDLYDYAETLEWGYNGNGRKYKFTKIDRMQNLLLLRMLYETAGRICEVLRYEWHMIDFDEKTINVPPDITKRNKSRTAEISDKTIGLLIEYKKTLDIEKSKNGRVLHKFKTYNNALSFMKKCGKKAIDKEITTHYFRHSFLTHKTVDAIKSGTEKSVIKERLRDYVKHSTTTTTEIYIKLAESLKSERLLEKYGAVP